MLNYDHERDEWMQQERPQTLEETVCDELGLSFQYRNYLLDDTVWTPEIQERLDRLDAYITGLEMLLTAEG